MFFDCFPNVPGFFRDPHKDHWGRLALDATWPWGRAAEFERKRIPGEDAVDLARYVTKATTADPEAPK